MLDSQVGYQCVTHPFAGSNFAEANTSLDLHALVTPPTFILSQDQTLNKEFIFVFIDVELSGPKTQYGYSCHIFIVNLTDYVQIIFVLVAEL